MITASYAGVDFDIRQDDAAPAYFMFGVRKSGSSIMNAMVAALAQINHVNYVDVAGKLFGKGVGVPAWQNDAALGSLLHGGNIYGGFRNAPIGIIRHPLVVESRKILLVRDPRDALVSEYFSNAYSHSIPEAGEARALMLEQRSRALGAEIGPYVLRMAHALRETLRQYRETMQQPGIRLYRYEDAILKKRWFMGDVCAHFGWRVSDTQLQQVLGWADVIPDREQPTNFVRKVVPGDHVEKLDAPTIQKLNELFREELALFGYGDGKAAASG
jgi:hypothetical protein